MDHRLLIFCLGLLEEFTSSIHFCFASVQSNESSNYYDP